MTTVEENNEEYVDRPYDELQFQNVLRRNFQTSSWCIRFLFDFGEGLTFN